MRVAFAAATVLLLAAACGEALVSTDQGPGADGGAPIDSPAADTSPPDDGAAIDGAAIDAGCFVTWDASPRVFHDISASEEGAAEINALDEAGILDPCAYSNYCPDAKTRRREILRWAVRATGGPPLGYTCGGLFTDLPADDSDFGYLRKAREVGLTGGCGGDNVCPDVDIDRASVAIIASVLSLEPLPDAATAQFADVPDNFARLRIEQAAKLGFMAPCMPEGGADAAGGPDASYFCPTAAATRRQVAIALARARALR